MPFLGMRRNTPPVVEVNLEKDRPPSRSSSRKEKLRASVVHLSRYFSRPKSAFSPPSLSSSVSSRSSDDSNRSFELSSPTKSDKVILEKTSTPEGFMIISKKPAYSTNTISASAYDNFTSRPSGLSRTLSSASRRGQPVPPPSMAQIAALKIYAEKALPPIPRSRPQSVTLSVSPPTDSVPPPAYLNEKPKPAPSAFATPTKVKRASLRPRTPKSPNNTDSFLSFSATPPRRYSFRAASTTVRTSFLSMSPSPSPSPTKRNKAYHRYSTTSQRMGIRDGAVLPPGKVELQAEAPIIATVAIRPMYRHPYATAIPASSPRQSSRFN